MPADRSALLADYDLLTRRGFFVFQLLLLANAVAVSAIFFFLKGQADFVSVFIYTFVAGNVVGLLMSWSVPLYSQPFPRNWIVYIALLLPVAFAASTLAAFVLSVAGGIPSASRARFIRLNVPFGALISFITGLALYIYIGTRTAMQQANLQLAQEVHLGQQEIASHASELRAAFEIQSSLLPRSIPQIPGVEISGAWQPARTVSGDFFDVLVLGPDRVGFCLADVSGKGMGAALITANLQATFRAFAAGEPSPANLCRRLNGALCGSLPSGRFVTFAYGILDRATLSLTYELAGHPPPLLLRASGPQTLDMGGPVLGLLPEAAFADHTLQLTPGDRLVLATDGVTEAFNPAGEEFGDDRLLAAASSPGLTSAHAIRSAVLAEVTRFAEGNFHDDASLLIVAVTAHPPRR